MVTHDRVERGCQDSTIRPTIAYLRGGQGCRPRGRHGSSLSLRRPQPDNLPAALDRAIPDFFYWNNLSRISGPVSSSAYRTRRIPYGAAASLRMIRSWWVTRRIGSLKTKLTWKQLELGARR